MRLESPLLNLVCSVWNVLLFLLSLSSRCGNRLVYVTFAKSESTFHSVKLLQKIKEAMSSFPFLERNAVRPSPAPIKQKFAIWIEPVFSAEWVNQFISQKVFENFWFFWNFSVFFVNLRFFIILRKFNVTKILDF